MGNQEANAEQRSPERTLQMLFSCLLCLDLGWYDRYPAMLVLWKHRRDNVTASPTAPALFVELDFQQALGYPLRGLRVQ